MEDEDGTVEAPPKPRSQRRLADRGASLVEYALLLALICLACLSALTLLGGNNEAGLTHSQSCIGAAMDGANPSC